MEIWKDITGYEGRYLISSLGRIKSNDRYINCTHNAKRKIKGKMINPYVSGVGYYMAYVQGKYLYIHRLMAIAFIKNPQNRKEVNHIDGNKLNNNLKNLEWVSKRENLVHYHSNNRSMPTGVYHEGKTYRSRIYVNGKLLTIGRFNSISDAHNAYLNYSKTLTQTV